MCLCCVSPCVYVCLKAYSLIKEKKIKLCRCSVIGSFSEHELSVQSCGTSTLNYRADIKMETNWQQRENQKPITKLVSSIRNCNLEPLRVRHQQFCYFQCSDSVSVNPSRRDLSLLSAPSTAETEVRGQTRSSNRPVGFLFSWQTLDCCASAWTAETFLYNNDISPECCHLSSAGNSLSSSKDTTTSLTPTSPLPLSNNNI